MFISYYIGYNISELNLQDFAIHIDYFHFILIYEVLIYSAFDSCFSNVDCICSVPIALTLHSLSSDF